jgi:hypothetical protein
MQDPNAVRSTEYLLHQFFIGLQNVYDGFRNVVDASKGLSFNTKDERKFGLPS